MLLFERPPSPRADTGQTAADAGTTITRWLRVWIVVGVLVVLVVIGFLVGIVSALESVDANLAAASDAVVNAEGDVDPLPVHIQEINEALRAVNDSVAPLDGQAEEIVAALASIDTTLEDVDGSLAGTRGSLAGTSGALDDTSTSLAGISESLQGTSGSLADTSASLVDTSSILDSVLQRAQRIETVLESAESPPDQLGASDIFLRVADANERLEGVVADTGNIIAGLDEVNQHLDSICNSPVVATLGAIQLDVECN